MPKNSNNINSFSTGNGASTEVTQMAERQKSKHLSLVIRIMFGAVLLVVVCKSVDLREVAGNFRAIHPIMLITLFVTFVVDRVLMAYKWNLLLKARSISISTWHATRLYYVGQLLGKFTPGAIGAEVYRVIALSHFQKNQIVTSTVILERFIGLAVICFFAAVGLPVSAQYLGASSSFLVVAIVISTMLAVTVILISFCPSIINYLSQYIPFISRTKISRKLHDFYLIYAESRFHIRTLLFFTILTALETVVMVCNFYLSAKSLGINISFGFFICVIPLVIILLRLPITIEGIGILEGLLAYFLVVKGFSGADGVAIAILMRLVGLVSNLMPACIFMWLHPMRLDPTKLTQ